MRTTTWLALPAALAIGCLDTETREGVDETSAPIINGDPHPVEQSGAVSLPFNGCSGTLLTNEWVLTAAHCGLDTVTPSQVYVEMGSQWSVGAYAVNHPSLDFALVRLATPMAINNSTTGFRAMLFEDGTPALAGKSLYCRGYGCNAYSSPDPNDYTCTGDDLRWAMLPVDPTSLNQELNFTVTKNALGQILGPGDSGSSCLAPMPQGWAVAGVLKSGDKNQSHLGRSENWRPWALSYIDERPVALPEYWHIGTFVGRLLPRPLPDSYQRQHTWDPCPGGHDYLWNATYQLEATYDFIYITTAMGTTTLNGNNTTILTGRGPFTLRVSTDTSVWSPGLLAMTITCKDWSGRAVPFTVWADVAGAGYRSARQGEYIGTRNGSLAIDALMVTKPFGVQLEYMAHFTGIGDTAWFSAGQYLVAGGQPMEGLAFRLTGPEAANYDVMYMVNMRNAGDTVWVKNGAFAGSRGQNRPIDGFAISIRRKN